MTFLPISLLTHIFSYSLHPKRSLQSLEPSGPQSYNPPSLLPLFISRSGLDNRKPFRPSSRNLQARHPSPPASGVKSLAPPPGTSPAPVVAPPPTAPTRLSQVLQRLHLPSDLQACARQRGPPGAGPSAPSPNSGRSSYSRPEAPRRKENRAGEPPAEMMLRW
jgi:hypothetical protein